MLSDPVPYILIENDIKEKSLELLYKYLDERDFIPEKIEK